MVRFTRHLPSERETVIRIDGQLEADALDELRSLVRAADLSTLAVDLAGLTAIDAAAKAYLSELRTHGVQLLSGSLYIKRLLEEV